MTAQLIITQVKVAGGSEKLELTSPYNPDMVQMCRKIGGRWNKTAKRWYFELNKLHELELACEEVYGYQPKLAIEDRGHVVVNTAFQAALDYMQGIKAQAGDLSEEEKNEVLMALLEVLS